MVGSADVQSGETPANQLASYLVRHRASLVLGGSVGLFLGLAAGYYADAPGWGKLIAIVPRVAGAFLALCLLVVAIGRPKGSAPTALLALVVCGVLGAALVPGAPGSTQRVSGTATAGTSADTDALWSGSVTCEWSKDYSSRITRVRGFDVPITDARFLAAEKLADMRVSIVDLWHGYVLYEGTRSDVGGPQEGGYDVDLEGVSPDGTSGTAVFTRAGGIVFHWSCAGGPTRHVGQGERAGDRGLDLHAFAATKSL